MGGHFPLWLWPILERARFQEEKEDEEQKYINYYRCPFDGKEWADIWSCQCNDACPKCGVKDIQPYKSEDVVHTKAAHARVAGHREVHLVALLQRPRHEVVGVVFGERLARRGGVRVEPFQQLRA